jgi:hypothetical protein
MADRHGDKEDGDSPVHGQRRLIHTSAYREPSSQSEKTIQFDAKTRTLATANIQDLRKRYQQGRKDNNNTNPQSSSNADANTPHLNPYISSLVTPSQKSKKQYSAMNAWSHFSRTFPHNDITHQHDYSSSCTRECDGEEDGYYKEEEEGDDDQKGKQGKDDGDEAEEEDDSEYNDDDDDDDDETIIVDHLTQKISIDTNAWVDMLMRWDDFKDWKLTILEKSWYYTAELFLT